MISFNWISSLSPAAQAALQAKSRVKSFGDNTTLYRQGDPLVDVFQIIKGEIRHCLLTEDGQEVLIHIYQPGDLVGDSSVFDGEAASVTFITRGSSELRAWSIKDFTELLQNHPEIHHAVNAQLSRRLRGALKIIEDQLTQNVSARIASRFAYIANNGGGDTLPLSQADIGLMVGSTRQSVNRVVTELRKLNLVETDYGKITIKDSQGLQRYASLQQRQSREF